LDYQQLATLLDDGASERQQRTSLGLVSLDLT